ncbi:hypothetical protein T492DRAFT_834739 [Pavlovales sp. CCMP2436]|nr:hypothetical protein T492DRAFT_834739 [Pavlovales sp. CCMP2436]
MAPSAGNRALFGLNSYSVNVFVWFGLGVLVPAGYIWLLPILSEREVLPLLKGYVAIAALFRPSAYPPLALGLVLVRDILQRRGASRRGSRIIRVQYWGPLLTFQLCFGLFLTFTVTWNRGIHTALIAMFSLAAIYHFVLITVYDRTPLIEVVILVMAICGFAGLIAMVLIITFAPLVEIPSLLCRALECIAHTGDGQVQKKGMVQYYSSKGRGGVDGGVCARARGGGRDGGVCARARGGAGGGVGYAQFKCYLWLDGVHWFTLRVHSLACLLTGMVLFTPVHALWALSEKRIAEFRAQFDAFDQDQSGNIDKAELKRLLRGNSIDTSQNGSYSIFSISCKGPLLPPYSAPARAGRNGRGPAGWFDCAAQVGDRLLRAAVYSDARMSAVPIWRE